MVDFNALVYGPTYAAFGTAATLNGIPVTVVDHTDGMSLQDSEGAFAMPAVLIRKTELAEKGLAQGDLATLDINGTSYAVKSVTTRSGLTGSAVGELVLILERA